MGGIPTPKPPGQRARRNKDPIQFRTVAAEAALQPDLPATMPDGTDWPAKTIGWWAMWGRSPLTTEFTENDWEELADTAILHGKLWTGNVSVATELRMRVANFGATPSDRAKLRIQFAMADRADAERPVPTSSRSHRGPLTAAG
jgi:hypothetical protein